MIDAWNDFWQFWARIDVVARGAHIGATPRRSSVQRDTLINFFVREMTLPP